MALSDVVKGFGKDRYAMYILHRDNGLPDQLVFVHYVNSEGVVFKLWSSGNKPNKGTFWTTELVPWSQVKTELESGVLSPVSFS